MEYIEIIVSKDGEIKTIDEARLRARKIEKGNIHIKVRGGEYFLKDTIILNELDSGNPNKRVTYEAYGDEDVILTSGIRIQGWEKVDIDGVPKEAKIYRTKIPEFLSNVRTMFDGNEPLERAHGEWFTNCKTFDYDYVDSLNVAKQEDRQLLRRLDYLDGQIKDWPNLSDIEIRFKPVPWTMNLIPLEQVDTEKNIAWLDREATGPFCAKNDGIRVENTIEFMKKEGNWCVNTYEGYIYLWPRHEDGKPCLDEIYIPSLQEYIRVEGYNDMIGDKDRPVTNIHFKGLTFKYGMTDRVEKGYKGTGIQHDWEMHDKATAVLRFRGTQGCSITQCHFHASSGTAIRLDLYSQNNVIQNNLIDNMGIMGILLCGYGPGTKDVNNNNIIRNNIISRCGQEYWHGHCIFLWQTGSNIVENNKIYNSARNAISLCGVRVTILNNPNHKFDEAVKTIRWHEINKNINNKVPLDKRFLPFLHTKDNIVRNNDVSDVLNKLADGAAINTSGAGENNLIDNNYIHHISTYNASGALRVDDWQRGTIMTNNIIYMTNGCGIVRKNYNHVVNNYIINVNCRKGYLRFASYPKEKAAYNSLVKNNIFYESGKIAVFFNGGYLVSDEASLPKNCDIDNNLYYVKGDNSIARQHIDDFSKDNIEQNSCAKDPLFLDLENEDFTLNPESPALELGINPIDTSNIGLIAQEFPVELYQKRHVVNKSEIYDRSINEEVEVYEWW